jgi:GNAT superfamily N-acetyltransferase
MSQIAASKNLSEVEYRVGGDDLTVSHYLDLVDRIWPGDYDEFKTEAALRRTFNITAWVEARLVGCVRILSDGYLFGTIPEMFVDPDYKLLGVGRRLMKLAWEASPTSLYFGAEPGDESFYEALGFEPGIPSFIRRKPRG